MSFVTDALDMLAGLSEDILHDVKASVTPQAIGITFFVIIISSTFLLFLAQSQKEIPLPPPAGCRRLGLKGPSNLSDQYSKKYSSGGAHSATNPWSVKAIFIYPLKSCRGVELSKTSVAHSGLKYDRQFTLAQLSTGLPDLEGKVDSEWRFITQRQFPRLAKVETEIWVPDSNATDYHPDGEWIKSQGCVVIRFPFTPDTELSIEGVRNYGKILAAKLARKTEPTIEFRVPFNPSQERIAQKGIENEKVKIWRDVPDALNMAPEVSADILDKLRYTLGVTNPLTLFRIDDSRPRDVAMCAPKKEDVGFQTSIGMQDSYPMHIMNIASVHDVSSRLPKGYKTLNALRYRANVYLTGPSTFDEDDWKKARIGQGTYHISCRTTRCKLPNVDPETAIADRNQPSTTMLHYRVIDAGSKSACLGMQVTPLVANGEIKVGDSVEVLERGAHHFLK